MLEDLASRNGTFLGSERVNRLEITSPYVVHFGHPEDGPVLRFELVQPDPFADFARDHGLAFDRDFRKGCRGAGLAVHRR